ncbi:MAG: hypothetical protein U1D30_10110 [Planctomycetota bacterium]
MASDAKILQYLDELENWVLDSECIVALIGIARLERKLLAARQYVRYTDVSKKKIWENWAWSDSQIEEWYKSDAYKKASKLIDNIKAKFNATNTGYKLLVSKKVRTLEEQLYLWRISDQVLSLGIELKEKVSKEIDKSGYSETAGKDDAEKFRKFLAKVSLKSKLMLAAPGLSDHGHGNAYDFVIEDKSGKRMASASGAWISTWDGPHGWTQKLKDAVNAAGEGRFKGPLASPYEPWHYEYNYT